MMSQMELLLQELQNMIVPFSARDDLIHGVPRGGQQRM